MPWKQGQKISVPIGSGNPQWANVSVECTERIQDAIQEIVSQLFEKVS